MQLTRYSDYSLRVLMYLAVRPEYLATIEEIAEAYGISRAHLMKVVHQLGRAGLVDTVRGRGGGSSSRARPARSRSAAWFGAPRKLAIVECFEPTTSRCRIESACGLPGRARGGARAFLGTLDRYTLADLVARRRKPLTALLTVGSTRHGDSTGAAMNQLLVVAEFVFSEEGERAFQEHLDRTLAELRAIDGCLHAGVWNRPGRRQHFSTLWTDATAVKCWVENEFHQSVLMPGFRKWCTEGWFGEYWLESDHKRARSARVAGAGRRVSRAGTSRCPPLAGTAGRNSWRSPPAPLPGDDGRSPPARFERAIGCRPRCYNIQER